MSIWQRLTEGLSRLRERADWSGFAGGDWAGRIMTVEATDRQHSKQGRSIGRWILHANGQQLSVYLKRHYRLPWWQGWLAAAWPGRSWSPAFQEWDHLEWARAAGFPVPRAVAAAEFVGPWGRLQSVLAVEELAGMLPLHEAVPLAARRLSAADFVSWKRGLVREMARLTRSLHGQERFHKDLYLCHFYVRESDIAGRGPADWQGRVHIIDLHRLGRHRWTWRVWQVKDLAQLLYSSEVDGVTPRDRLRFWRLYGGGPAWMRRLILMKWRRYRGHNRKRSRDVRRAA